MTNETKTPRPRRWAGRAAALSAAVATLMIGSIAAATWVVSGTGDGSADAATVTNLTAEVTSDALYPGLTTDGTLIVTNTNPFQVKITAVNFDGAVVVGDPAGTCTASNSEVTFTTVIELELIVSANATDEEFEDVLTDAIAMGGEADNDCQGRTFSRPFTLTAEIYIP